MPERPLHCKPECARPLAQLVHEKTGGNPFFAIQFFTALDEEGLLAFDPATPAWQWDNGPNHDASRRVLNAFIRNSVGIFDGIEDFDAATLDPSTGNISAEFLPNSTYSQLPLDYLHPHHAGYIAMGEAVDIGPFAPNRHRRLP